MWQGREMSKQHLGGAARHYLLASDTPGSITDALRATGEIGGVTCDVLEIWRGRGLDLAFFLASDGITLFASLHVRAASICFLFEPILLRFY